MRGHDEDVYSVAWSPSPSTVLGEETHEEWLVASSSRDRTCRLWSSRQGRVVHSVRVPVHQKGGKGRADGAPPAWITCCWPEPGKLLTSGGSGEIY